MRVLVLGYIVRGPLGGMAWHHLQYVLGLAQLGCEVYFFEDSDEYASCYDPLRDTMDTDPSYGLRFAASAFERLGLEERWAYFDAHRNRWLGPASDRALGLCRSADVLLNISGSNPLREWHTNVPVRVFVDTDPVFTQIRHLTSADAQAKARQHTAFFSYGENIGRGATVPDDGLPWLPTRQPIALNAWSVTAGSRTDRFTTVMQWDSYPAREYGGRRYGVKSDSFLPYVQLPHCTTAMLELAVGGPTAPADELRKHGWIVSNPLEIASDPWRYQQYIRDSKAEFTVAKQAYVVSRSGWFSERSAAYLASGRPVVTQDTAFGSWLPTGRGVLAFDTPENAANALAEVDAAYEQHCTAARNVAQEYFEARKVLRKLLDGVGSAPLASRNARGSQTRSGE